MSLTYHSWKRWLLAVLLALPLHLCFAADLVDQKILSGLASDSNEERVKAITALGLLSTPGAAAVLAALGDGNVLITSDGAVLLSRGREQAFNPVTGETVSVSSGMQSLTLNNRLRRALQSALASSELFSSQPKVRLAAAQRLQKEADATRVPIIERALAGEKDPSLRRALEIALASAALKNSDPTVRRQAVIALCESKNPAFKSTLLGLITADSTGQFREAD